MKTSKRLYRETSGVVPKNFLSEIQERGILTKTGRLITLKGVKPEGIFQWGRKTFWLYGAVELLTGNSFFAEFDTLNGDCFQQFLDKFSSNFEGSTIILQMDKAPAHITQDIDWPENIIPIYQPSYSPELNPIERLWEYINLVPKKFVLSLNARSTTVKGGSNHQIFEPVIVVTKAIEFLKGTEYPCL